MSGNIKYILLIVGLLISNLSCNKQNDDIIVDVEGEIQKEMESALIPSVVTCIVKDGQIAWEGAFGYANIEYQIPATRETYYTLMSISKLFLSTSVMQLWEKGMIDLEADINQYLPFEVRNPRYPDKKITPYMLLNHRSSLAWPEDGDRIPDFHHFYTIEEEPPLVADWLPEYILPGGAHYRSVVWKDYAPGEKELYSNIATSLLGLIVENISGEDYRDYCTKNIFEPLEMHNSTFRLSDLNYDYIATPYTNNNNPMYYYTCRHYPAGFISSTIEDFSHFVIAFLNKGEYKGKRILQEQTVDKMLTVQNPGSGVANLWWHCMGDCFGHKGGGTGFSTWVEWHPDDNSGLFIFSNKVNGYVWPGGRIYELVKYKAKGFRN